MKEVTIRDIAAKTGCSIASVSRALNHGGKLLPETRKRILSAANEMGYRRSGKQRIIALILPRRNAIAGFYPSALLQRIVKHPLFAPPETILMMLSSEDVCILHQTVVADGVLSIDYSQALAHKLPGSSGLPFVCINDTGRPIEHAYSVCSNEVQGVRLAVRHLFLHGHRRIGFILNETALNRSLRLRRESFLQSTAELGCANSSILIERTPDRPLYECIAYLLKRNISALMVGSEGYALETVHILNLFGKRIPEDISLLLWEQEGVTELCTPRITAVCQDFDALADSAAELLQHQLDCSFDGLSNRTIDYLIFERESVRTLPGIS